MLIPLLFVIVATIPVQPCPVLYGTVQNLWGPIEFRGVLLLLDQAGQLACSLLVPGLFLLLLGAPPPGQEHAAPLGCCRALAHVPGLLLLFPIDREQGRENDVCLWRRRSRVVLILLALTRGAVALDPFYVKTVIGSAYPELTLKRSLLS